MAPKVTPGLSGQVLNDIPAQWSATWFRDFCLHYLQYGDVRNANAGAGITISGTIGTPAGTISVSADVQKLFSEPFVLAVAPSDTVLTKYRTLTPQAGVLTVTDGGAESSLTIGVEANGIGNTQIRQGVALSVIGNATGALASVADIAAAADNTVLQRSGGALSFGAVALPALAAQAAGTVVGNNAVGSAAPIALTAAQTKTLLAIAYTDVSGLATVAHSGAYSDLSGTPSIPTGANPSASVGLSAVNGSSASFLRADGAPALDVTIAPTWTGLHIFSKAAEALRIQGDTSLLVWRNSATTSVLQIGSVKAWSGTGSNVTDAAIGAIGALNLYVNSSTTAALSIATTGVVTLAGSLAGTPKMNFATQATTGAHTATFTATNKPGSATTAPDTWLPLLVDGVTHYIPCFL